MNGIHSNIYKAYTYYYYTGVQFKKRNMLHIYIIHDAIFAVKAITFATTCHDLGQTVDKISWMHAKTAFLAKLRLKMS